MTDNYNPVSTKIKIDDGKMFIGRSQDCTPIAEYAKAMHNSGNHGGKEMRHAAKIPLVIIETYMNVHGVTFQEVMNDEKHFRQMLNDPDLKQFRIWPGRV
jgi:hypothetical protein